MIDIAGLAKRYRSRDEVALALSHIDLTVEKGEGLALLGTNGAGKSTLIRILCTLLTPDSGRARVASHDVVRQAARVRESIGVVLQSVSLHSPGRVRQILILHAQLHGFDRRGATRRSDEVLDLIGLNTVADRRVRQLSGGMQRRLDLGLALIHCPPVLLLDEPTSSLDPASREEAWTELARLRDRGTCVLVATQDLEEAARIGNRTAILADGKIELVDTSPVTRVKSSVKGHVV